MARRVKDLVDGEYMKQWRLRERDDGVLGLESLSDVEKNMVP